MYCKLPPRLSVVGSAVACCLLTSLSSLIASQSPVTTGPVSAGYILDGRSGNVACNKGRAVLTAAAPAPTSTPAAPSVPLTRVVQVEAFINTTQGNLTLLNAISTMISSTTQYRNQSNQSSPPVAAMPASNPVTQRFAANPNFATVQQPIATASFVAASGPTPPSTSDPLQALLNQYQSTTRQAFAQLDYESAASNTTTEPVTVTQHSLLQTVADLSNFTPQSINQPMVDGTHYWFAASENEANIQAAMLSPDNGALRQLEDTLKTKVPMTCSNTARWSGAILSSTTRSYCCGTNGNLPASSKATICLARLYTEVNTFTAGSETVKAFFSIQTGSADIASQISKLPSGPAMSQPPIGAPLSSTAAAPNGTIPVGRRLLDAESNSLLPPCTGGAIQTIVDALKKGSTFPPISCCLPITPVLDLCFKTSGDLVTVTQNNNQLSVCKDLTSCSTYCAKTQVVQTNGKPQLAAATPVCTGNDITDGQAVGYLADGFNLDVSLCLIGGDLLNWLTTHLGFGGTKLCFADVQLSFYGAANQLGFNVEVGGVPLPLVQVDGFAYGTLQLAEDPTLCTYLTSHYDPTLYCSTLTSAACFWKQFDAYVDVGFSFSFAGTGMELATTVANKQRSRACQFPNTPYTALPGPSQVPIVTPPPVQVTQVTATFCTTDDNKNGGSTATFVIVFNRPNQNTLTVANLAIPSSEYKTRSNNKVATSDVVHDTFTQAQLSTFSVSASMAFHAGGSPFGDGWNFNAFVRIAFSAGIPDSTYCLRNQHVGAGGGNPSTSNNAFSLGSSAISGAAYSQPCNNVCSG